MKASLVSRRELAPGTFHFEFESAGWTGDFQPGQFISLSRVIDGNEITRAYSIASAPSGSRFELCANLVEGGRFTPFLFSLKPGDDVDFTGPWGTFTLRRTPADSVFVATGTGIAPFRAMLPVALDRTVTLIFGARYEAGLLYDAEFRAIAATHSNFHYLPTLTRPGAGWTGATGRVQPHVMNTIGDRRDLDIYICGMREMVDNLRAQLKALGFERRQVVYERYD